MSNAKKITQIEKKQKKKNELKDQHVYIREISSESTNDSFSKIESLIPENSTVLDLGCGAGQLAKRLIDEKGCTVCGIDFHPETVEAASKQIDDVICADVTKLNKIKELKGRTFDCVIFADVLEHIQDPKQTLEQVAPFLAEGGSVYISLPNITHGSIRLNLLKGNFNYTDEGLLDKTHLRFFSYKTALELCSKAGYLPVDEERTYLGIRDAEQPVHSDDFITDQFIDSIEGLPDATTMQFVFKLIPIKEAEHRTLIETKIKNLEYRTAVVKSELVYYQQQHAKAVDERIQALEEQLHQTRDEIKQDTKEAFAQFNRWARSKLGDDNSLTFKALADKVHELHARIERYINIAPFRILRDIRWKIINKRQK